MDTYHYEVVVCGPDLAGAVAAALIARRGYRVLLCGHDAAPGTFQAAGYTLAASPGILPASEAEPVARIFRELNYVPIVRRRAPPLQPGLQIVYPGGKLALGAPPEALARELERGLPTDHETAAAALESLGRTSALLEPLLGSDLCLPPHGFWERREVARVAAQLPAPGSDPFAPLPPGHPLRAALGAYAGLTTGYAPQELGAVAPARAFDLVRRGCFRMAGGLPAVRGMFTEKVETFSGEIRERVTPLELVQRRGRIVGLRLGPREETVGLDHLVWAGAASGLQALLGDKAPRKLREVTEGSRPACYRYTVAALVRPEALPASFGPRVLAIGDLRRPLFEDNALLVTVGAPLPRDPDRVPLWVECLVPAAAMGGNTGYLALVRARLRERLSELLPFFDLHLLVLASPHDGLPPEAGRNEDLDAPLPPLAVVPMPYSSSWSLPRPLEVGGVPYDVGLKNVLVASAETLPGLGTEGEFIAAYGATRLLLDALPNRAGRRRAILIRDG